MANIQFHGVSIRAVATCVPKQTERISDLNWLFSEKEQEIFSKGTGIFQRRIAGKNICTSDLCFAAAKKLFSDNDISPSSIDAVLFVSKTADYIIPATSALLQDRLKIPQSALCLDLRLACSGYVYALSAAYAYASQKGIDRVLLLAGDTNSKIVSRKSKSEYPVFGDGGSATLIEKGSFADVYFDLGTDGGRGDAVIIPCENGGRNAITEASLTYKTDENGNERNLLQMHMKGMDVFSFAISAVPKSIQSLSNFSKTPLENVDGFLIHQANRFILQTLAKKLKVPADKMPMNIDRFGNTSSASIPLLMATVFSKTLDGNFVLCGFGSGLSWASMMQEMRDVAVSELVEIM